MALDELKKIEKQVKQEISYEDFLDLGKHLVNDKMVHFKYRDKSVTLRGIQEDFRVYLNGELVCECVFGNITKINKKLAQELLK